MSAQCRSGLFVIVLSTLAIPVLPQGKFPPPDPATNTVIRPGKVIGVPPDAEPEGPPPSKPGANSNPANPADPNKPGVNPGGGGGGLNPPPGLTVGAGFRIARWMTFRRITNWQGPEAKNITNCRLSKDGSKIAFSTYAGSFVINSDGTNLVRLSDKYNANPGLIDISADGRQVVWYDVNERGLYVGNSDGSDKAKMPVSGFVSSLRLTAKGDRLFVLVPEAGGIFSMPSDGSDLKRIMTTSTVCKLLGIEENGNHWRGWPSGIDISDDGSRVVFHLLWDAFAMNGDGSGLRRLTQYLTPEDRGMDYIKISGDGKRFAMHHQADTDEKRTVTISDWDGANTTVHAGNFTMDGAWMQLNTDGSKVALSWGLRVFDGMGKGRLEASEWGSYGGQPTYRARLASISGDGRRISFTVDDNGHQLVVADINPASLAGFPTFADIGLAPRFIMTDGTNEALATTKVTDPALQYVGITGLRDGFRFPEWSLRPVGALNDQGASGDKKAGDGIFTTAGVRLFKPTPKDAPPGPITIRFFAWNKQNNALFVDLEGFEARTP